MLNININVNVNVNDIIGITESRYKCNQKALQNSDIPNYNTEHCPTEGPNGGVLVYVKSDIIYKVRNKLKIYQSEKLESVFIEIHRKSEKNKEIILLGDFNIDLLKKTITQQIS